MPEKSGPLQQNSKEEFRYLKWNKPRHEKTCFAIGTNLSPWWSPYHGKEVPGNSDRMATSQDPLAWRRSSVEDNERNKEETKWEEDNVK